MSAGGGYQDIGHGGFPAPDNFDKIRSHPEICQPFQAVPAFIVITDLTGIGNISAQPGDAAGGRTPLAAAFGQPKFQGQLLVFLRELIDNGYIIQTAASDYQYIYIFHINNPNGP
jgi:hypothetical protein